MENGAKQDNVYAYTFACPDIGTAALNRSYESIFNIADVKDFVSWTPGGWSAGFSNWEKYGRSYWYCEDWDNYETLEMGMCAHNQAKYLEYLRGEILSSEYKTRNAAKAKLDDAVSWRNNKFWNDVKNSFLAMIGIHCPVDVEIYSSDGRLVGSAKNNIASVIYFDKIYVSVTNDEKDVYLLDDDTYTLRLEATDDGVMDYFVHNVDVGTRGAIDGQDFENVTLAYGKQFTSDVEVKENIAVDVEMKEVKLYVLGDNGKIEKEVLADGKGTEITVDCDEGSDNSNGEVLPGDMPDGGIPDGIWSAGITDTEYTGSSIAQSFRLYDGNKRLQEKVDYTVSYKNNKTAYTYTEEDYADFAGNLQNSGKSVKFGTFDPKKAPQIIIKMKGNYSGSRTIYFRIQPADITGTGFAANDLAVTYSGKKQIPSPTLTWNGKALKYNTDFYVPEYDNAKNDKTAFSESGTYGLTIAGRNNFTGEILIKYIISDSKNQIAMSSVTIKGVNSQVWTGQQIQPSGYTVKYKADVLSETNSGANGDYTVSIGKNTAVGTGTITFIGTGKDADGDGYSYIGTKTMSFKITGTAMSKVGVSGVDKSYTYTGAAIQSNAVLTYLVNKMHLLLPW